MTKNLLNLILLFLLFVLTLFSFEKISVIADTYENSTLNLSVDVKEPIALVEINPSSIYLGEITKGYSTNFTNVTYTNKGNLKIRIKPTLNQSANPIFGYLEFNTASCSTSTSSGWYNISEWNGLTIDKPSDYNGTRSDYACIRLNLKNYNETIFGDLSLTTQLIIWIMPA